MDTSKLVPNDRRVQHVTTQVRGKSYRYVLGQPKGTPKATMVLIHGFPDFSFGWRYQVPYFMSLGYRVIVPDMLGYAGTDAPYDLNAYSLKSLSDDIEELCKQIVGDDQIILGGHDWGGFLVWRVCLWHPERIRAVFSICTPHNPPQETFFPLEVLVSSGRVPNFAYQLQLAGPEVESRLQGEDKVRQLLNALYGGFGPNREVGFTASDGVQFDNLGVLRQSRLLSEEELDYYTREFMRRKAPQLRGPLNWYRTRKINFVDELPLAQKGAGRFEMPALFITASQDSALPPAMSKGMDVHFKDLTRHEVKSSHWALWQASSEVNATVEKWADKVMQGPNVKSSL